MSLAAAVGESLERTPSRGSRLLLAIAIALGALLLYVSLKGVAWHDAMQTVRRGNPELLALAFPLMTLSYALRSLRWRILIGAVDGVTPVKTFWAVCVGYLGNLCLPARSGDLLRTVLLSRSSRASTSYLLATTAAERMVDALVLVLLASLTVGTAVSNVPWLLTASHGMAVLGSVGLLLIYLLPRLETRLQALVRRATPAPLAGRADVTVAHFLLGLRSLHELGRIARFLSLTAPIWLVDGTVAVCVAQAFHLPLSLPQALFLLAALGLSSAAPSTPGYAGIYQFVAVTVLTPLGYARSDALVYILAFQACMYSVTLTWGLIGLWQLRRGAGSSRSEGVADPDPSEVTAWS